MFTLGKGSNRNAYNSNNATSRNSKNSNNNNTNTANTASSKYTGRNAVSFGNSVNAGPLNIGSPRNVGPRNIGSLNVNAGNRQANLLNSRNVNNVRQNARNNTNAIARNAYANAANVGTNNTNRTNRRTGVNTGLNLSGNNALNALLRMNVVATNRNNAQRGAATQGTSRVAPILRFGKNGKLFNNNFASKPALPRPEVPCKDTIDASVGLRGANFKACFIDHLKRNVAGAMRRAEAAIGNANKMNAMCTEAMLSPHQIVVYELAKLMSIIPPERLGEHRGLLAWHNTGSGKCFAKDTPVLMYDGSVKAVQDVKVGDTVMGDSSTPRTVLSLASGEEEMYDIVPSIACGDMARDLTFTCNASHILVCKHVAHKSYTWDGDGYACFYISENALQSHTVKTLAEAEKLLQGVADDEVLTLSIRQYLELPDEARAKLRMYTASKVDFPTHTAAATDSIDPWDVDTDALPSHYLTAPLRFRRNLLARLLFKHGAFRSAHFEMQCSSAKAAADVVFLARSTGFFATVLEGNRVKVCDGYSFPFDIKPRGLGKYYGFAVDGNHRFLLGNFVVVHNSITSLAIILAFWPSSKRIVLVSTKVNTAQAIESYKRDAPRFFPKEVSAIAQEFKTRKSSPHLSDKEAFDEALKERVSGLTFVEARNRIAAKQGEFKTIKDIKLYSGEGAVLIIDEAQGLAMKSRSDPNGDAIRLGCALRSLSKDKMRKIHVFCMTATPGVSVREWLKLLSVVRRADQRPFAHDNDSGSNSKGRALCERKEETGTDLATAIDKEISAGSMAFYPKLAQEVQGLCSYVDIRSDRSRHACSREKDMRVELDRYYYLLLLLANAKDRRAVKSASDKAQHQYDPRYPDIFMKRMRILGNSLPKTMWGTLPKGVQEEMARQRRILKTDARSQGRYVSNKLIRCAYYVHELNKINPGKHYIYTVSGNEYVLATALRTWHGVQDVTRKSETFDGAYYNKKTNKVVGLTPGNNMVVLSDQTRKDHKERITQIFNSPANVDGKYIRIVIATGQLFEGLDLAGLRYISLLDALPSTLMELQAVGRGVRNCSHRKLPMKDRQVTILRWFASAPSQGSWAQLEPLLATMRGMKGRIGPREIKEEYDRLAAENRGQPMGYDELVFQRSRADPAFRKLYNFERVMQTLAFDCQVLGKYHRGVACMQPPSFTDKITLASGSPC